MKRLLAALALVASFAAPAAAQPRVVASILPLQSLTAGVMEGIGEPAVLVRGNASPHTAQLRPSDAQALARAQLVIWIGPIYESFLARPLRALGGDARVIELARVAGRLSVFQRSAPKAAHTSSPSNAALYMTSPARAREPVPLMCSWRRSGRSPLARDSPSRHSPRQECRHRRRAALAPTLA